MLLVSDRKKLMRNGVIGSTADSDSVSRGSSPFSVAGNLRRAFSLFYRSVAQLGRALRSGRRGRRFKSCHSDFLFAKKRKACGLQLCVFPLLLKYFLILSILRQILLPPVPSCRPYLFPDPTLSEDRHPEALRSSHSPSVR